MQTDSESTMQAWDYFQQLSMVDGRELRYASGFLQAQPERWFPGFAAHWLPLLHSLGSEIKIVDVSTSLSSTATSDYAFAALVDDEAVALVAENGDVEVLLDMLIPGSFEAAKDVAAEYLARRLVSSLARTWSSADASVVRFDPEMKIDGLNFSGSVRIRLQVSGTPVQIHLLLGRVLIDRLDQSWRRQVRSSQSFSSASWLCCEFARLFVPPSELPRYLQTGTKVDLEQIASDQVQILLNERSWLPGKLRRSETSFVIETIVGAVSNEPVPEGMTQLSIRLPALQVTAEQAADLTQPGAMLDTQIPLGTQVQLCVGGDEVGRAELCTFSGNFAMKVL